MHRQHVWVNRLAATEGKRAQERFEALAALRRSTWAIIVRLVDVLAIGVSNGPGCSVAVSVDANFQEDRQCEKDAVVRMCPLAAFVHGTRRLMGLNLCDPGQVITHQAILAAARQTVSNLQANWNDGSPFTGRLAMLFPDPLVLGVALASPEP